MDKVEFYSIGRSEFSKGQYYSCGRHEDVSGSYYQAADVDNEIYLLKKRIQQLEVQLPSAVVIEGEEP